MILGSIDSRYDEETTTITGDGETIDTFTESEARTESGSELSVRRARDQGASEVAYSGGAFDRRRQSHTFDVVPSSRR